MLNKTMGKELAAIIQPDGEYELDWLPGENERTSESAAVFERALYDRYCKDPDGALFDLGLRDKVQEASESVVFLQHVAAAFVKGLIGNPDLEALRDRAVTLLDEEEKAALLAGAPFLHGGEHLHGDWLDRIWTRLNQTYHAEICKYTGSVTAYFRVRNPEIHFAGKVYFHLVESKREEYPFAFLATYAAEISPTGAVRHLPLKNALMEYGQNSKKLLALLASVNQAAQSSRFIGELLQSGEIFHPIGLNPEEAYTFLKEVPFYEKSGILCRIPNWWRKKTDSPRVSVRIGAGEPPRIGAEALLDFDVRLALGDETVTPEELRALLASSEGLALIKGKWIEVDRERLTETLLAYEKACRLAEEGGLTIVEALRMSLPPAASRLQAPDHEEVEITNGQWLDSVLARLKRPETIPPVNCGVGFKATLREYQKTGLAWLNTMRTLGLGACLADDMGLGKTVQVIALLNHLRAHREAKTLIVVPASLISNWTAEIARFAPRLRCFVIHPQESKEGIGYEMGAGIYLTSYGMLARTDWLAAVAWDMLISTRRRPSRIPAPNRRGPSSA